MLYLCATAFLFGGLFTQSAQSQAFDPEEDIAVEFATDKEGIRSGGTLNVSVILKVPPNYHITDRELGLFFVEFDSVKGLHFSEPLYPPGVDYEGDRVYQGNVIVRTTLSADPDLNPGPISVPVTIGYQICAETGSRQCFFPVSRELNLNLTVLPSLTTKVAEEELPAEESEKENSPDVVTFSGVQKGDIVSNLESALERGSILALLLVFIGGILTSFTPCVYPIIPITIGYIGARSEGNKLRGFFLSLFFVLGLALMYSTLGIIAALSGGVFGGLTQHPAVYAVMIVIFLAMGASMMGAFDLQLPAPWQAKLQSGQRRGIWGAVLIGMASGLIAAPCVGPVLVALLAWVAKTGSVIVGFGLLFTFSLGLGLLFVVIGTFAGALTTLPQAGGWMEGIKHFFGWLLWATAVYFASIILPDHIMSLIWGAFLILLAITIGAFRPSGDKVNWRWILRKWVGILSLVAGLSLFVFGISNLVGGQSPERISAVTAETSAPDWIVNDVQGAYEKAASEQKPLMMDFYADWCVACVELDHKTYNQPEVLDRLKDFISLKMDFTRQSDWTKQMTEKYQVMGMPTVIFFDSKGDEIERFVGFKNAREFMRILDGILSGIQ